MQNNNSMVLVHHQKNGIMIAFAGGLVVDFLESKRAVILLGRNVVMISIKKKNRSHTATFLERGLSNLCF